MRSNQEHEEKELKTKAESEYCVSCGKKTDYTKATPIDCRLYYVEGGGQLCRGCGREIYG